MPERFFVDDGAITLSGVVVEGGLAGHLAHTIGARFPLDQIVSAHEAVEAGAFGNEVIELA